MNPLSILYKIGYFPLNSITLILSVVMKSKDFQNLILSKGPKFFEILTVLLVFAQLNGGAKAYEILTLSICQVHRVVRELFGQRDPFKRSNID